MKKPTLKILIIVFLILLVACFLPVFKRSLFSKKTFLPEELNLSFFNQENTSLVIIKTEKEEINLAKENFSWRVNSFPVDQKKIDEFFESLKEIKFGYLASKNPQNFSQFSVDQKEGISLTLKGKTGEKTVILGKSGHEINSFYARGKEENNVYLLKGELKNKVLTSVLAWRDKKIADLKTDQISKLEVEGKIKFILFKNKEGKWEIQSNKKSKILEENQILPFLSSFSPLEAYDFVGEKQKQESQNLLVSKNSYIINFKDNEEKILAQLILAEKDGDYFVKEKSKEEIFKVYSFKINPLLELAKEIK